MILIDVRFLQLRGNGPEKKLCAMTRLRSNVHLCHSLSLKLKSLSLDLWNVYDSIFLPIYQWAIR